LFLIDFKLPRCCRALLKHECLKTNVCPAQLGMHVLFGETMFLENVAPTHIHFQWFHELKMIAHKNI